jgi:hypothetical protein
VAIDRALLELDTRCRVAFLILSFLSLSFFFIYLQDFTESSHLIAVGRKWTCTNIHTQSKFYRKLPPRLIELGPGEATLDGLAFGPSSSARTYTYCRPFPSQSERGARVEAHQSIMEA